MTNKTCVMLLAGTLILGSCGEKNRQDTTANAVKVKTMTIHSVSVNGQQGYSGAIEEMSGASLSFASMGTLRSVSDAEGQMVRQGALGFFRGRPTQSLTFIDIKENFLEKCYSMTKVACPRF